MKKFFRDFKVVVNDSLGDEETCQCQLLAYFKIVCKMKGELNGATS